MSSDTLKLPQIIDQYGNTVKVIGVEVHIHVSDNVLDCDNYQKQMNSFLNATSAPTDVSNTIAKH